MKFMETSVSAQLRQYAARVGFDESALIEIDLVKEAALEAQLTELRQPCRMLAKVGRYQDRLAACATTAG